MRFLGCEAANGDCDGARNTTGGWPVIRGCDTAEWRRTIMESGLE